MTLPANEQPAFARLTGITITHIAKDRVEGEMPIRPELGNRNGVAHGGAIMTFTDNLAGTASTAAVPEGHAVTTLEAKLNFFAAIPLGDIAHGVCTPLHIGRTTQVWESRITRGDGRLAAVATHTQLVIAVKPGAPAKP